jgi:CubicO group peptidase (beta-lactamase class C family)
VTKAASDPESVGMSGKRLARIKPAMQAYVDRGVYAGVSTLVARRGKIVHEAQVGWRDKEAQTPVTADTIFRLYSMTKPIVCTALMTLYEEARFRLIDPVADYIPTFARTKVMTTYGGLADPVRPPTIRDLMSHMSGLTYHFLDDSPVGKLYEKSKLLDANISLEAAIDDLASLPLAYQPGTRWHYSVGIDVVGRLIEVISGRSLGEFLRERIFGPLGMSDAAFGVPTEKRDRLAAMYGRPDVLIPGVTSRAAEEAWRRGVNDRIDVSATYPADRPEVFQRGGHGLFGTAGDILRFAQMLLNGGALDGERILGRKTLALMHANYVPPALMPLEIGPSLIEGYGFGLGSRVALDVAQISAAGSVGEFGWSGAAKTHYWVDPQEQIVAVFMTQSMLSYHSPELDLRALVYQALDD